MPKVYLSKYDKKKAEFRKWFVGKCKSEDVKQSDLGKALGVSQVSISRKLDRTGKATEITYEDLLCFFNKTNATDEEILKVMRL